MSGRRGRRDGGARRRTAGGGRGAAKVTPHKDVGKKQVSAKTYVFHAFRGLAPTRKCQKHSVLLMS